MEMPVHRVLVALVELMTRGTGCCSNCKLIQMLPEKFHVAAFCSLLLSKDTSCNFPVDLFNTAKRCSYILNTNSHS